MKSSAQTTNQRLNKIMQSLGAARLANKTLKAIIVQQAILVDQLNQKNHDQAKTINELRTNPQINPIHVWNILEGICDYDESFHFPQPIEMRVQNLNDEKRTIIKKILARDVICICSVEKGHPEYDPKERRKKLIFLKEETAKFGVKHKCFLLNNEKSFDDLWKEIDNLGWWLCPVSKNALVNVGYYDLVNSNLALNETIEMPGIIRKVTISKDLKVQDFEAREAFIKIKKVHDYRLLFQKRAIGFRNQTDALR